MNVYQITDAEFNCLRQILYDVAGIVLNDSKKVLLTGRLAKRLRALGLETYTQYIKHIKTAQPEELQVMVDLLTTNETYFFREPAHFEFLKHILANAKPGRWFRVWSAAASTGAEAYTIAMILADQLGETGAWEILGTDISRSVLEQARRALYPLSETAKIPPDYLRKYCLKGVGEQEGTFLVHKQLRDRVHFEPLNLNVPTLKSPGEFDVIFLRNVLIYFDVATKKRVVENLVPSIRPGGHLIVGHSETLNGITDILPAVRPTIYRRI